MVQVSFDFLLLALSGGRLFCQTVCGPDQSGQEHNFFCEGKSGPVTTLADVEKLLVRVS